MVRNVGGAEDEVSILLARFRQLARNLRVLDDAKLAPFERDDSDRFGGFRLFDDFGPAVGACFDAVAEEDGVGDADEAVVDTVGVEVRDSARGEVGKDRGGGGGGEGSAKGGVDSAVAIGRDGDRGASVEEDLALVREAGKNAYSGSLVSCCYKDEQMESDSPCSKKMTSSFLSPKKAFFSKNSSVGRLVGPLVMMYQGIPAPPATSASLPILSA